MQVFVSGFTSLTKIEEVQERSRVLVLCTSTQAFGSHWTEWRAGT